MWYINFKPLKRKGRIRRKYLNISKRVRGRNKKKIRKIDSLLWVSPKSKTEIKASVQVVCYRNWPGEQQWSWGIWNRGGQTATPRMKHLDNHHWNLTRHPVRKSESDAPQWCTQGTGEENAYLLVSVHHLLARGC